MIVQKHRELASSLGWVMSADATDSYKEVNTILSKYYGNRPCLLFLDDVWDPKVVEKFVFSELGTNDGCLLVTTQRQKLWDDGKDVKFTAEQAMNEELDDRYINIYLKNELQGRSAEEMVRIAPYDAHVVKWHEVYNLLSVLH